jgi:DNA-binding Lrp family transcriptional regulator
MAKAIVLIKSNPGVDREVAGQIKKIEGVENVYLAAGRFDIVAEIQTPVTYDKIRVIGGIRDTHTMFCLKV